MEHFISDEEEPRYGPPSPLARGITAALYFTVVGLAFYGLWSIGAGLG